MHPRVLNMAASKGLRKGVVSIKDSIHVLVSILSSCGAPSIQLEYIRLAKFNKPHVASDILRLLYFVCCITPPTSTHRNSPLDTTLSTPLEEKWMLLYVQRHLLLLGYTHGIGFYTENSSRELLLALGWVILSQNVIYKIRVNCLHVLKSNCITCTPSIKHLFKRTHTFLEELNTHLTDNNTDVHMLSWLQGRVYKEWSIVNRLITSQQQLIDKLHHYTSPLSLYELYLLRYPNKLKEYCKEMEKQLSILQLCLEWEVNSCTIVSQWLNTVLELARKEEPCNDSLLIVRNDVLVKLQESVRNLKQQYTPHLNKLNTHYMSFKHKLSSNDLQELYTKYKQSLLILCMDHQMATVHKDTNWSNVVCSTTSTEDQPSISDRPLVLSKLYDTNEITKASIESQLKALQHNHCITITFQ